eukprot:Skav220984  [mRNA]  locus=scaffold1541:63132:74381:+ [translate_table: standard]
MGGHRSRTTHSELFSKDMVLRFGFKYPGTIIDIRSYYTFGTKLPKNPMLAYDKQSILFVWRSSAQVEIGWRVNGTMKLRAQDFAKEMTNLCDSWNEQVDDGPDSFELQATGPTFLNVAMKDTVLHEARYFVSLQLPVILYALVMMLMLCTALSFDYSLFTMTRYGEERRKGAFKSFCLAACSMILCCIGVQLTFVPCLLGIFPWLGAGFDAAQSDDEVLDDAAPNATWLKSGFAVGEVLYEEEGEEDDIGNEDLEEDTPETRQMKLSCKPGNIVVPIIIYVVTFPLTYRCMQYQMGHAYELQVPRGRKEWETALQDYDVFLFERVWEFREEAA